MTFKTRDGNTATLEPVEFLRRFTQHVLPARFVKIRHYGLMAAGNVHRRWKTARALLDARSLAVAPNTEEADTRPEQQHDWQSALLELTGTDVRRCPACGKLAMVRRPLPECRAPPLLEAP